MGYYVKPIVCDYGVYNDYDNELCLVCNRKANAELIVKILQVDNGDDAEHHHDKVCRNYEQDCTRKPLERIVERLEGYKNEYLEREQDAKDAGLNRHADLNGIKAYMMDVIIEIVKEEMEG